MGSVSCFLVDLCFPELANKSKANANGTIRRTRCRLYDMRLLSISNPSSLPGGWSCHSYLVAGVALSHMGGVAVHCALAPSSRKHVPNEKINRRATFWSRNTTTLENNRHNPEGNASSLNSDNSSTIHPSRDNFMSIINDVFIAEP